MKKKNNFFIRKCLICKTHKHKLEFIRFYIKDSELFIDEEQNNKYRGYYICNNQNEISKFLKRYQQVKSDIKINEYIKNSLSKQNS